MLMYLVEVFTSMESYVKILSLQHEWVSLYPGGIADLPGSKINTQVINLPDELVLAIIILLLLVIRLVSNDDAIAIRHNYIDNN